MFAEPGWMQAALCLPEPREPHPTHHVYPSTGLGAACLLRPPSPTGRQLRSPLPSPIPLPLAGPCSTSPRPPLIAEDPALTNDDCPVIRDKHLAVDIDELRDWVPT